MNSPAQAPSALLQQCNAALATHFKTEVAQLRSFGVEPQFRIQPRHPAVTPPLILCLCEASTGEAVWTWHGDSSTASTSAQCLNVAKAMFEDLYAYPELMDLLHVMRRYEDLTDQRGTLIGFYKAGDYEAFAQHSYLSPTNWGWGLGLLNHDEAHLFLVDDHLETLRAAYEGMASDSYRLGLPLDFLAANVQRPMNDPAMLSALDAYRNQPSFLAQRPPYTRCTLGVLDNGLLFAFDKLVMDVDVAEDYPSVKLSEYRTVLDWETLERAYPGSSPGLQLLNTQDKEDLLNLVRIAIETSGQAAPPSLPLPRQVVDPT
jgi:hypothetical protein